MILWGKQALFICCCQVILGQRLSTNMSFHVKLFLVLVITLQINFMSFVESRSLPAYKNYSREPQHSEYGKVLDASTRWSTIFLKQPKIYIAWIRFRFVCVTCLESKLHVWYLSIWYVTNGPFNLELLSNVNLIYALNITWYVFCESELALYV